MRMVWNESEIIGEMVKTMHATYLVKTVNRKERA